MCEHRKRVCVKCWLLEKTPLAYRGLERESVLRLAFQSDVLLNELSRLLMEYVLQTNKIKQKTESVSICG